MRPVTLSAENIELSPPTDTDAAAIADAICDPDIAYWIDVIPWPYTVTDALFFIHQIAGAGWESGQHLAWVLRRKGACSSNRGDRADFEAPWRLRGGLLADSVRSRTRTRHTGGSRGLRLRLCIAGCPPHRVAGRRRQSPKSSRGRAGRHSHGRNSAQPVDARWEPLRLMVRQPAPGR